MRVFSYEVKEKANWKTALSAQNELYHIPFQHHATIPDFAVKKDGRHVRLQDVRFHGKHSIYSSEAPGGLPVPTLGSQGEEIRLPLIGDFDFYTIFPNFALLIIRGEQADSFIVYNFWPEGVGAAKWDIGFYFVPPKNAGERLAQCYQL